MLPSHPGGILGCKRWKPISAVKAAQVQRVLQLITWETPSGALHPCNMLPESWNSSSPQSAAPWWSPRLFVVPHIHGMLRPSLTHHSLFAPGQERTAPPGYSYPVWATLWSFQSHLVSVVRSDISITLLPSCLWGKAAQEEIGCSNQRQ